VAGASGGIGLETAKLFYRLGARVTCHYHSNPDSLLEAYRQEPFVLNLRRTQRVQADLTRESAVTDLFNRLKADPNHFGPVQVIVVNHGIWEVKEAPLVSMTLDQWENTVTTNLTSCFLVIRSYLQQLQQATDAQKAKVAIVMIGSTAGRFGEAGHADYAATKSAMMYGLTLSLKNEIVRIAPQGRVNCIAPGWVATPMAVEALKDPELVYRSLATTPLKTFSSVNDIAKQIVILASNEVSSHVSGEVITVAGGMEGRLLNKPEELLKISCAHFE